MAIAAAGSFSVCLLVFPTVSCQNGYWVTDWVLGAHRGSLGGKRRRFFLGVGRKEEGRLAQGATLLRLHVFSPWTEGKR